MNNQFPENRLFLYFNDAMGYTIFFIQGGDKLLQGGEQTSPAGYWKNISRVEKQGYKFPGGSSQKKPNFYIISQCLLLQNVEFPGGIDFCRMFSRASTFSSKNVSFEKA